jgi:glucose/arabinose dehydrogenase
MGVAVACGRRDLGAAGVSTAAVRQRQQSLSRQLAAEAQVQAGLDMNTAMRLALRAYQTTPTVQARSALLSIASHPTYQAQLAGHGGEVKAVVFTPDGQTLISGGQDRTIVLWDLARRTRLAVLRGQTSAVRALALSPDGRLLASAGRDGAIIVWDLHRRTPLRTLTGHTDIVDGVAFSPDGQLLASVGVDHTTIVWDVASGTPRTRLNGYGGSLAEVAFKPRRANHLRRR